MNVARAIDPVLSKEAGSAMALFNFSNTARLAARPASLMQNIISGVLSYIKLLLYSSTLR